MVVGAGDRYRWGNQSGIQVEKKILRRIAERSYSNR